MHAALYTFAQTLHTWHTAAEVKPGSKTLEALWHTLSASSGPRCRVICHSMAPIPRPANESASWYHSRQKHLNDGACNGLSDSCSDRYQAPARRRVDCPKGAVASRPCVEKTGPGLP